MSAGDFLLALTHSAPPDEMPERILTCFWCCRDRRFLVAPSGLAAGQGCARRHHWGRSRLRTGQQIQIDPRLLRLAGGIPATGCCDDSSIDQHGYQAAKTIFRDWPNLRAEGRRASPLKEALTVLADALARLPAEEILFDWFRSGRLVGELSVLIKRRHPEVQAEIDRVYRERDRRPGKLGVWRLDRFAVILLAYSSSKACCPSGAGPATDMGQGVE